MKSLLNKLSLLTFDFIASRKGYRFTLVKTAVDCLNASRLYAEEGGGFGNLPKEKVKLNKPGVAYFIAYFNGEAVGAIKLSDPNKVNMVYEMNDPQNQGILYDIHQSVIKRQFSREAPFIMLGLLKAMYAYSASRSILCWNADGSRNIYLAIRKYSNSTEVNFSDKADSLSLYLNTKKITSAHFTIDLSAIRPARILSYNLLQYVRAALPVLDNSLKPVMNPA